jgi:diaminopimelate decarboxylase
MKLRELDFNILGMLSQKMGNSFYIFSNRLFEQNYIRFSENLKKHYKNSHVAYAVKANYMPEILRCLSTLNGSAEVVSNFEYDVARMFFDGREIIFNGPVKSEVDIKRAIQEGSSVNIDSWYQIESIKNLSKNLPSINIGVRYNSSEVFPDCRFGFNAENGDLAHAVEILKSINNVRITSLHSHYSSSDKSPSFFEKRARKSIQLHKELNLTDLQTINVGGGFMGNLPDDLLAQFGGMNYSFESYAEILGRSFSDEYGEHGPRLVIEPGVSLIGDTMKLVAKVLEIKEMHGTSYAVLDTSINVLNPTRSKVTPSCSSFSSNKSETKDRREYTLVGNTCMETDILVQNFKGTLSTGDFIVFDNRGAYSNNFTPAFIMPQPGIVTTEGKVVKQPDDIHSILNTYS